MSNIRKLMNKLIMEITLLIVICITSFAVFSIHKLEGVVELDDITYTDIDVEKNDNPIGINNFTDEAQIKLKVSNDSNTFEDYKVLLTSNDDLSRLEDYLKIRINNNIYLLKDLKVANNYFLIDKGNMKADTKEFDLYFAIDEENEQMINNSISLEFVNDLTI